MSIQLFHNRALYEPLLPELNERIRAVVAAGQFVLGPEVEAFEGEFAAYLGVKHVVGVANGTDALAIALRAAGVAPGDEVVVPSFTFYATAEAAVNVGAVPVFCDVAPDTYCVRAQDVERVLTERTGAIIPVHLFGNVAPMAEIASLAKAHDIAVVEDAAQAAGASLDGVKAGALGDAAAFSFFPSKNLFCFGDGGAVVTDNDEIAAAARGLRAHGSLDKRAHSEIGYNSRLDELQATILRRLLHELDGWNQGRRRVAKAYEAAGLGKYVELPKVTAEASHAYHLYVTCNKHRDEIAARLAEAGVEARSYYTVAVHRQPAMEQFGLGADLPVTQRLAQTNLALPMGPNLGDEEIEQVVAAVANLG